MKLPKITDLVGKDKKVYFSFYRDGELWYKTHYHKPDGFGLETFEFPIPPDDMKGAIFKAEDKSIFFMRFIRKHLDYLSASMKTEQLPEMKMEKENG